MKSTELNFGGAKSAATLGGASVEEDPIKYPAGMTYCRPKYPHPFAPTLVQGWEQPAGRGRSGREDSSSLSRGGHGQAVGGIEPWLVKMLQQELVLFSQSHHTST